MKRAARIVIPLLILATLAAACTPTDQPGKIELSVAEFDFGTIPNNKRVSQTFQVRNAGQGALEITGVSTSCGCTTAKVDKRNLEPGETVNLTVTYDPQAHSRDVVGKLTRVVYVRSDDPETPEANLMIRVTVVKP